MMHCSTLIIAVTVVVVAVVVFGSARADTRLTRTTTGANLQRSFATTTTWLTVDDPALSLRYPPGWRVSRFDVESSFTQEGYPRWDLSMVDGDPLTVDGLAAKSREGPDCDITITKADRELEVVVARTVASGNLYRLAACFSGPAAVIQLNEAKFHLMVESVKFSQR